MSNRFLGGIVSAKPQTTSAFTSRASTGTYFNNTGTLVTAAVNQPRLNYSFSGNTITSRYSTYFNGSSSLSAGSSTALAFGSNGLWTFEAWVYPTASMTDNWIVQTNDAGNMRLRIFTSGYLGFYTDTGAVSVNSTTVVTVNTWSHVAATYDGTTLRLWQNGVQTASSTVSISNGTTAVGATIGNYSGGNRAFTGYISNVRIVKGVAVYTGAFTVPTAPLTATQSSSTNISAISGTSTSLLTCQSNSFNDNSSFALAMTGSSVVPSTFVPLIYPSDFSGTGWSNPSVLIEPASTNLLQYSQSFNSVWSNDGYLTLTLNAATAPDGTNTAYLLTDTTSSATHRIYQNYSGVNYTQSQVVTASVFLKAGTLRYSGLLLTDNSNYRLGVIVDLAQGTITQSAAFNVVAGIQLISCNITNVNNGWYRVTLTGSASISTSTGLYTQIATSNSATGFGTSGVVYAGTGTGSIYAWGAQTEIGYTATSYIPTTSSQVSRSQDDVGTGTSGLYRLNDLQVQTSVDDYSINTYTLPYGGYFNYPTAYLSLTQPTISSATDFTIEFWFYAPTLISNTGLYSAAGSRSGLIFLGTGALYWLGIANADISGPVGQITANKWYHVAAVRRSGTLTLYLNGTSVGSGASTDALSSTWYVGSDTSNERFLGYISNLRVISGQGLYTGTFNPATAPLTATSVGTSGTNVAASITGTVNILTLQSSTIVDNSGNGYTITNNGNVAVAGVTAFGSSYYWTAPADVSSVETLVVAGGGGGGISGGGAGGVIYNPSYAVTPGQIYTINIGQGGSGTYSSGIVSYQGGNSSFGTLTAVGGGGTVRDQSSNNNNVGYGGSGGGAALNSTSAGTSYVGAPGIAGQGYPGGTAIYYGTDLIGGGGGGAGGPGLPQGTSISEQAGTLPNGGPGLYFNISGTSTAYAGGGGGATRGVFATAGSGGVGGGGTGYVIGSTPGGNATGYGSGGGGGAGGGGGSAGIVIVKYKRSTPKLTSLSNQAVVTQKFIASNTWTVPAGVTQVEALVVAGGGGGGYGRDVTNTGSYGAGGGGAGGLLYNSSISVTPGSTYGITIGAGGLGAQGTTGSANQGFNGFPSAFANATEYNTNYSFSTTSGWSAQASATVNTFPGNGPNGGGSVVLTSTGGSNVYSTFLVSGLTNGTQYVVSFWAKGSSNFSTGTISFTDNAYNSGNTLATATSIPSLSLTWTQYSYLFTANSANQIYISIFTGGTNTNYMYVSQLSVRATILGTVGGGGGGGVSNTGSWQSGLTGGSGGGVGSWGTITGTPGSGTVGQGNAGGTAITTGTGTAKGEGGGGGGGAGGAGGNASYSTAGYGGPGLAYSITGSLEYYAGGGGGASDQTTSANGLGGVGGGGAGANGQVTGGGTMAGTAGTPNTGGGGGGASAQAVGGNGGSGVVILRYRVPTVAIFQDSGTWTCPAGITSVQALVVAGGGGGAPPGGAGGGAGGLIYNTSVPVTPGQTYPIAVGQGGDGGVYGTRPGGNGQNSSFANLVAYGGGGGGGNSVVPTTGGSGGGASGNQTPYTGAAGTYGQGNSGGGGITGTYQTNGGGGGAGGAGAPGTGTVSGAGGPGLTYTISGSSVTYAGGGGGAGGSGASISGGTGGSGGGGSGGNGSAAGSGSNTTNPSPGVQNTGGGGGGFGNGSNPGERGGSGIVIIRWYGG